MKQQSEDLIFFLALIGMTTFTLSVVFITDALKVIYG